MQYRIHKIQCSKSLYWPLHLPVLMLVYANHPISPILMLVYANRHISPILMLIYTNRYISPVLMLVYTNHRISPSHLPLWRGLGGCLIHKIQCSKSLYWPLHLPHPNARLSWPSHLSVTSPPLKGAGGMFLMFYLQGAMSYLKGMIFYLKDVMFILKS